MNSQVILLLCAAIGAFNGLHSSATPIGLNQLSVILNNNRGLPFYIDSATFGVDNVTAKVQYHAARGKLYIPSKDTRDKAINFNIGDKKYSVSFNANKKYMLPSDSFFVTDDTTYTDNYTIYMQERNDPCMTRLNKINQNAPYTYIDGKQNVIVGNPPRAYQTTIRLGISKLQNNFGNVGVLPVDQASLNNNLDGKNQQLQSYGQGTITKFGSCLIQFKITIDNRDLQYSISF
jgi:hypothetical protein